MCMSDPAAEPKASKLLNGRGIPIGLGPYPCAFRRGETRRRLRSEIVKMLDHRDQLCASICGKLALVDIPRCSKNVDCCIRAFSAHTTPKSSSAVSRCAVRPWWALKATVDQTPHGAPFVNEATVRVVWMAGTPGLRARLSGLTTYAVPRRVRARGAFPRQRAACYPRKAQGGEPIREVSSAELAHAPRRTQGLSPRMAGEAACLVMPHWVRVPRVMLFDCRSVDQEVTRPVAQLACPSALTDDSYLRISKGPADHRRTA